MSYNPNIPQPNDLISASQAQIQTNFSQADTIFDVDHVTFDNATTANRGKHRKSTYIEVADPVTLANEIALYAKDLAGATTLYLRQENNGNVVQMTAGNANAKSGANTAKSINNGETFLPGGFLMKFGTSIENSANRTVIFTTDANLDAFNTIYSVFLMPIVNSGGSATLNTIANGQFTLSVGATVQVFWMAIGI